MFAVMGPDLSDVLLTYIFYWQMLRKGDNTGSVPGLGKGFKIKMLQGNTFRGKWDQTACDVDLFCHILLGKLILCIVMFLW